MTSKKEGPLFMGNGMHSMAECYLLTSELFHLLDMLGGLQQAGLQGSSYTDNDKRLQFNYEVRSEEFVRKVKQALLGDTKLRRPIK